ncbi:hypothetical protein ACTSKR_12760 [Chitinibacteraceae bacterium HSL-7]
MMRFRMSDQAQAQRRALNVPMWLVEALARPDARGAGPLLGGHVLAAVAAGLRDEARAYAGLFVVCDGRGTITSVARVTQRLAPRSERGTGEHQPRHAMTARRTG